jgi:hypothetical protein
VLCVSLVATVLALRDKKGAATPRESVELFVAAAANRDRAQVARLLRDTGHPADVEAAFTLVPVGARAERIDVQTPFGSDIAFAVVQGVMDGRSWSAQLTVAMDNERWYVTLGEAPDARPRSSTTRP